MWDSTFVLLRENAGQWSVKEALALLRVRVTAVGEGSDM